MFRSFIAKTRVPVTRVSKLSSAVTRLRQPIPAFTETWAPTPMFPTFQSHKQGLETCYRTWAQESSDKALMVNDLGAVERQVTRWASNLPGVQPFYAVKCNPDPILIAALSGWGANFDCASRGEIQLVLNSGVDVSRIIFANPIKTTTDLRFAHSVGVTKMTFDNIDEINKIKEHCPNAQLVLRLLPDDSGSVMRFGSKFGAPIEVVESLLRECQLQEVDVIGFSFHIGSGCFDAKKYDDAILLCKQAFEIAERLGMPPMTLVDIGGGFPGDRVEEQIEPSVTDGPAPPPFEKIATVIRSAFSRYFPEERFPDLVRIGEPGRYFAKAYSSLFLRVQGRRAVYSAEQTQAERFLYYVNDGVYGSFNCKLFDYYHPVPTAASSFFGLPQVTPLKPTLGTFFGPTCDSLDKIVEDYPIDELQVGDSIVFTNMGAYTSAAATEFNGCPLADRVYIHSVEDDQAAL